MSAVSVVVCAIVGGAAKATRGAHTDSPPSAARTAATICADGRGRRTPMRSPIRHFLCVLNLQLNAWGQLTLSAAQRAKLRLVPGHPDLCRGDFDLHPLEAAQEGNELFGVVRGEDSADFQSP